MQSWMIIGGVTFSVAFGTLLFKLRDINWAVKLQRPDWMFFEPAMPLITNRENAKNAKKEKSQRIFKVF